MIIGVGCDIIEIERISQAIEKTAFIKRVFASVEITYCQSRGTQAAASFAVRFAAKEAVLKAFGTGLRGGRMQEIIIINDDVGKPQVKLQGFFAALATQLGVQKINISLSHARNLAMAYVVMEDGK